MAAPRETLYEVLGIPHDSDAAEIRRAYLRLARDHHPDRADDAARGRSEERMRVINEAWSVLGDPERRRAYDLRLRVGTGDGVATAGPGAGDVTTPSRDFTPFHAEDEDDDDTWRYEPDEYDPRTGIGRWLSTGGPLLVLAGLGVLALALIMGGRVLLVGGFVLLVGAVVAFVGTPILAMAKGQDNERRVEAERRRRAREDGRTGRNGDT